MKKYIKRMIFLMTICCLFHLSYFVGDACGGSLCKPHSGSYNGSCPTNGQNCSSPPSAACYVDSRSSYCPGHKWGSPSTSSSERLSNETKTGGQYDVYYTHGSESVNRTYRTRPETRHYKQDYIQTYTITTTSSYSCTICGTTFPDKSTTTRTAHITKNEQDSPITEYSYRVRIRQWHQNTTGGWNVSDDTTFVSGFTCWTNCHHPDKATSPTSASMSWTIAETPTHHSANTHSTYAKSDADVTLTTSNSNPGNESTRSAERYVYRKRYWQIFYSNPQAKVSTPIEYIRNNENSVVTNPIDIQDYLNDSTKWQERAFTRLYNKNLKYFQNDYEKVYARLSFVEENYNIPTTYDLFQEYGYYSNDEWYSNRQNGADVGCGQRSWVNSLMGWNNPNNLYKYIVYATWISEPGELYLMPNSQFDGGTDSCYGAYIDNVNDNEAMENLYQYNSRQ